MLPNHSGDMKLEFREQLFKIASTSHKAVYKISSFDICSSSMVKECLIRSVKNRVHEAFPNTPKVCFKYWIKNTLDSIFK